MTKKETAIVTNFCKRYGITENQYYGIEELKGIFMTRSKYRTTIPKGFNPTVGGNLDLRSMKTIPEGFNPTVGGNLYLSGLETIPEGFNPTVEGNLYLHPSKNYTRGINGI